jgi:hypothetical protein
MKRTLLTLAIVAAAAGTAVAQTSPPSSNSPSPSDNRDTTNGKNGMAGSNAVVNDGSTNNANTPASSAAPPNMANATGQQMNGAALTAQKAIERDGYRNVQGLAKGSDGLWHGQAMRGNTQVQVTVDRSGTVSAR